ncbi:MAG TPA: metal ABC transporter permease [Verrucomicrobiota bacterium]|nr:metal ABC transporter permease [Verrucomicrobiota bacterium]
MNSMMEILSADFLLRNSLYVSVAIGLICPIIGVYIILRRMVFLGIALPQISSFGIALVLSIHIWFGHANPTHYGEQNIMIYAGAIGLSLIAIIWLAFSEKQNQIYSESRLGAVYAIGLAASILILAKCPVAEQGWMNLLKGEIISVSNADLWLTIFGLGIVVFCFWRFNREFTLVSFDREMAITLKKNVLLWDLLLFLLIGATIAIAVLVVGPLVAFGFIIIPPLISRGLVKSMRGFIFFSSLIGGVCAFLGFMLAYKYDLPVGALDITLLGVILILTFLFKDIFKLFVKLRKN